MAKIKEPEHLKLDKCSWSEWELSQVYFWNCNHRFWYYFLTFNTVLTSKYIKEKCKLCSLVHFLVKLKPYLLRKTQNTNGPEKGSGREKVWIAKYTLKIYQDNLNLAMKFSEISSIKPNSMPRKFYLFPVKLETSQTFLILSR